MDPATVLQNYHSMHPHERAEVVMQMDEELGEWLDYSKRETLQLCPRKYYYRYVLSLVPPGLPDSSLTFGAAIHAFLASWYDGTASQPATCPCPSSCEFCEQSTLEPHPAIYGKPIPRGLAQFLINHPFDPDPASRDPRTRELGLRLIGAYVRKYARESFDVLAIEISFIIPFDKLCTCIHLAPSFPCEVCRGTRSVHDFNYIGKIDLIIKQNGEIKIVDHKTSSRFGLLFEQQFKLSHQFTGYMHAVARILGIPISEGVVNAMRVNSNVNETESFIRLETTRTPNDFETWEAEVRSDMRELRAYHETNVWPRSAPFACSAYNRTCPYYGACISNDPGDVLNNAFEKKEWKPL